MRLGSAGAKAMSVVNGETDIYVHDGGMYQWDSAAPAAVALAAGLHVSRIDGSPIVYNGRDPWLPDFIVCRKEWAAAGPRPPSGTISRAPGPIASLAQRRRAAGARTSDVMYALGVEAPESWPLRA